MDPGHKARDDSWSWLRAHVTQATKTLRTVADLRAAGLLAAARETELDRVAARYAVAITPDMAALIDRADPR